MRRYAIGLGCEMRQPVLLFTQMIWTPAPMAPANPLVFPAASASSVIAINAQYHPENATYRSIPTSVAFFLIKLIRFKNNQCFWRSTYTLGGFDKIAKR